MELVSVTFPSSPLELHKSYDGSFIGGLINNDSPKSFIFR